MATTTGNRSAMAGKAIAGTQTNPRPLNTVYARQLFNALTCPKHLLTFTSAEGAGEHCEFGNRSLFHQRVFDWLDTTLHVSADVAGIDAIGVTS